MSTFLLLQPMFFERFLSVQKPSPTQKQQKAHLLPGSDCNHILVSPLVESHLVLEQNIIFTTIPLHSMTANLLWDGIFKTVNHKNFNYDIGIKATIMFIEAKSYEY